MELNVTLPKTFLHFFSMHLWGTRTPVLGITSEVFYPCSNEAQFHAKKTFMPFILSHFLRLDPSILGSQVKCSTPVLMRHDSKTFYAIFSLASPVAGLEPPILEFRVQGSTLVLKEPNLAVSKPFYHFSLTVLMAGLEPLILELRVKSSTTVLPSQNLAQPKPCSRIRTLNLRFMSQVVYHWVTTSCYQNVILPFHLAWHLQLD
jgi:hypothetical protein